MPPPSKSPVVLKTEKVVRTVVREPIRTGSEVLVIVGAGLLLLGLVDVVFLWFPLDFGNPAWRFGMVGATVRLLPLSAAGAALLTYGLVRHPEARGAVIRGVSLAFWLLAGLFGVLAVLYLTAAPAAFAAAQGAGAEPLGTTVIRVVLTLLLGAGASSLVAIALWRGVTEREKPRVSTPMKVTQPKQRSTPKPVAPLLRTAADKASARLSRADERGGGEAKRGFGESAGTEDVAEPEEPVADDVLEEEVHEEESGEVDSAEGEKSGTASAASEGSKPASEADEAWEPDPWAEAAGVAVEEERPADSHEADEGVEDGEDSESDEGPEGKEAEADEDDGEDDELADGNEDEGEERRGRRGRKRKRGKRKRK